MSKKQHSAKWWAGHWDVRDKCGSYTDMANLTGPDVCKREDGQQAQRKLKRTWQADRARAKQLRAERAKAPKKGRREQLREQARLAQHDQDLRAERQAMGYKRETAAFYGSAKEAQAEHSERRITLAQADADARREAERDREEAAAWRERQKAKKRAKAPIGQRFLTPRKKAA